MGVLGTGLVQRGGSLPRHIPVLDIYVSAPGIYVVVRDRVPLILC